MRVADVSWVERVVMRSFWSVGEVRRREIDNVGWLGRVGLRGRLCREWEVICTLLVHALLYGVFIVGFGGVLEGATEARCCHFCA